MLVFRGVWWIFETVKPETNQNKTRLRAELYDALASRAEAQQAK